MHTIWATLTRPIEAACRARTEATVSRHDARQKIRKKPSEFLTPSAGHDSGPRRAMAVVPRAQLAGPPEAQTGEWHAVTLLDGSVVEACYQGNLGSPAVFLPKGVFSARNGRPASSRMPAIGSGSNRSAAVSPLGLIPEARAKRTQTASRGQGNALTSRFSRQLLFAG
jgi:hypothetical protein